MEFLREDHAIVIRNDQGEMIAEITYKDTADAKVKDVDHTYTANELRGQGIAGKLLDALVSDMATEDILLNPVCPYVVRKFDEEPEKYGHIDARR